MMFACGFHEWHLGPYGEAENSRVAGSISALATISLPSTYTRFLRKCSDVGPTQTAVSDEILREALGRSAAHRHTKWGDRSPLDVFNRLIAKHKAVRPPGGQEKRISTSSRIRSAPEGHEDYWRVDSADAAHRITCARQVASGHHRCLQGAGAIDGREPPYQLVAGGG